MLKFGVISEIDAVNGLARVYFEEDDFVSAPLKIGVPRSGDDKVSFPYNIDEHVYCLMDENLEYGVVCGAIYDESNKPHTDAGPGIYSLHFDDGSSILYDGNSHTLSLNIKGKVTINCDQADVKSEGPVSLEAPSVSIKAVKTSVDGILEVSGAATIKGVVSMGGISGVGGAPVSGSTAEISVKKLTATNDVVVGNISLTTHKHTSTNAGNPTSTPIP